MTYMGKPYYPLWLDNLADDVTLEAAAMDGTARGADDVRFILVKAREQYEHQEFNYAGPCGESGFIEDYSSSVRGLPMYVDAMSRLLSPGYGVPSQCFAYGVPANVSSIKRENCSIALRGR